MITYRGYDNIIFVYCFIVRLNAGVNHLRRQIRFMPIIIIEKPLFCDRTVNRLIFLNERSGAPVCAPVLPVETMHERVKMISAITNQGRDGFFFVFFT
ncbi:MAG: hypothetical protein PHR14_06650 [Oscillospiraceae bacterium]|nr:hypothetical protein [Oscillospiraceae bacterium]